MTHEDRVRLTRALLYARSAYHILGKLKEVTGGPQSLSHAEGVPHALARAASGYIADSERLLQEFLLNNPEAERREI